MSTWRTRERGGRAGGAAAAILLAAALAAPSSGSEPEPPAWARVSREQLAAARELGVPVALENSLAMRFVLIPAGKFDMGSRDPAAVVARRCAMPNAQAGWFHDEHPRHAVTLTRAFYLSIHEVSQGAYAAIMDPEGKAAAKRSAAERPEGFEGARKPVVNVSWTDAERFCKALRERDGRTYFLPTEAQWEYACRAGTTTPFSSGETISPAQANYNGHYTYAGGPDGPCRAAPVDVGSLPPNRWGLCEMHGNVSEWCRDWYGDYAPGAAVDPQGPEKGSRRVVRGGSWRSYPGACRSACRLRREPGARSLNVGLRVGCALPAPASEKASK